MIKKPMLASNDAIAVDKNAFAHNIDDWAFI